MNLSSTLLGSAMTFFRHRTECHVSLRRNLMTRSLAEAVRNPHQVEELDLSSSADLTCSNLMCEKVGQVCICKLAVALDRLPNLKKLNLSGNRLQELPPNLWEHLNLQEVDLSDNLLTSLPTELVKAARLKRIVMRGNKLLDSRMLLELASQKIEIET